MLFFLIKHIIVTANLGFAILQTTRKPLLIRVLTRASGYTHASTYWYCTIRAHLFTLLSLSDMNIRIVTCVLLGIAVAFTIIGVATNQWQNGNLLQNSGRNNQTTMAIGCLLIVGAVLLCIALIVGVIQVMRSVESFALCVIYSITLYLGVAALLVAMIVYTEMISKQWSYFITAVGCTFALQVAILVPTYTRCVIKSTTTRRTVRVNR
ncbi:hypothetical protein Aperf_G00000061105 [Anoplocephala perfoliata]